MHQESRDPLTGSRKCKLLLLSLLCRKREDPFRGAQVASGAEIKCLIEPLGLQMGFS